MNDSDKKVSTPPDPSDPDLLRSRIFLQSLLDSSHDIAIRAVDKGFRYLFFNATYQNAIKRIYGADIAVGMKVLDTISVDADKKKIIDGFNRAFSGESHMTSDVYGGDVESILENYYYPIKDEAGCILGALSLGFNVTDRKRAEEALRQSEGQFKALFMSISDGFYLSEVICDEHGDPCDYRYVEINPQFEEIMGMPREQIIGKRYREMVPVDTTNWFPNYSKVAKTGQPSTHEFYSEEYKMYFETYAYKSTKGQIAVFVRNITEKKNTEKALQNAQKLESLGILAGGIAHDFNNMLCGLFGFIDLAISYLADSDPPKAAAALSSALKSFETLSSLTNQLLTFSKGGAPCRKTTKLEPVIKNSIALAMSGSSVRCTLDITSDLLPCECDKNQISQVLTNILINAKQAMPDGGDITVVARNVTLLPHKHADLPKGGNFIKISIKDNGVGIQHHIMKNIFDPFFTTKVMGHGLGLSTAFSIIRRHEGIIEAESKPGGGSTFHVFLPAAVLAATPLPGAAPAIYKGKGPILVMDDDESIREVFRTIIERMGHTVMIAKNGEVAVSLFKKAVGDGRPFVVTFLDLTIKGGKGGLETLREIRLLQPHAKVVVTSGYSNNPIMAHPSENGFDDSLSKPFTSVEIARLFTRLHSQNPGNPFNPENPDQNLSI
jgi:PAS domain S-box-containing protein